ncbi:MAG: hypothetical protein AAB547_00805 [Patescibacteria group bacterium]
MPDVVLQPELLFDPQVIIAKDEICACEKAEFLLAKQCPSSHGWNSHRVVVSNISDDLEAYLKNMPPSGDHPLSFYAINCVGLKHDTSGLLRHYGLSGAFSGINEYDAYNRFKEVALDGNFFTKPDWVGGLARIVAIPEKQLFLWKNSWVPLYSLGKWTPAAEARVH